MTSDYMQQALSLASKAVGTVSPNPAVGAIIVRNGRIVGKGYTQPPGSAHAEIMALKKAGSHAQGATMYVTLEPCCHHGRTPPCTQSIIESGIAEVHMAMLDPNPKVSGKGQIKLENAQIKTFVGEYEEQAKQLNEAYIKHITTGIPFVTAKFAMSLDGKIATRTFDSKWITGEKSRQYVHQLRRNTDAIMVGVNTVLKDDPQLTARLDSGTYHPLKVIVDSHGQTPVSAKVLQPPEKALIATTSALDLIRANEYGSNDIQIATIKSREGMVDLEALLQLLGKKNITSVLVEGGGTLLGSLFDLGLVDRVIAFVAPVIIGGSDALTPVTGKGAEKMADALRLSQVSVERFEDDIMITARLNRDTNDLAAEK